LGELPVMTDPQPIAITRILDLLSYPTYDYSKSLLGLMAFVGVQTSLKYGNSIWSARLYSLYSVVLADIGDFAACYQMGQLALRLFDRLPNPAIEAKIKFDVAFFSLPCQQPLRDSLPLHRTAIQAAIANGDLLYGGVAYFGDCAARYTLSEPLDELLVVAANYRQAMVTSKDGSVQFLMEILESLMCKLHRPDLDPTHLLDDAAADLQAIERLNAERGTVDLSVFYAYKQYLRYMFEDIPAALQYADLGVPLYAENSAPFSTVQLATIESLIRLAAYPHSSPHHQRQLLDRVTYLQKTLARRAKFAPFNNIQVRIDTIAAERCRVLGERLQAIELYDRAIAGATADRDLHYIAIGNELAAKFYLEWGKEKIAAVYLQAAYSSYALWGAHAKTADLARRYPHLLVPLLDRSRSTVSTLAAFKTITATAASDPLSHAQLVNRPPDFDLASVLQSIRVLSSTLDLEELLQKLSQIVLTNSGAQTCILAMPDSLGEWQIGSLISVNPDRLPAPQLPHPLTDTGHYPVNTIYWVKNTRQQLAIDATKPLEIADRYLLTYQPQSVLCVPILKQDRILGVLYLEHRQAPNLFDLDKQTVITFLCAQAAIAVENTSLYRAAQASAANIQSQQTYLATLLDNIPHLAWLKDEHSRFIATNRQFADIAGVKDLGELVGKTDFDFWPDLAPAFQDEDLRVMASGCRAIVEQQVTHPNGTHYWLETIKTPIRDSDGKITGTVGIALDITERRQMEEELRRSQQQYQQLADNVPGAIYQFVMAPDGSYYYGYISSGCQELFELSPAEVMADGYSLIKLLHPEDVATFDRVMAESARNLTHKEAEWRVILPSGKLKWMRSTARPERHADGSIVWDGVMVDITDRQVTEQALLASQRQYQRLADNIPGVIYQFCLTPDGKMSVPYMSSGCQELFGIPPATIVAEIDTLVVLTHPDDLASFQSCVADSARNLTFFAWEGRVILADLTTKWVKLASRPELQPDGAILWDGVMLDITARKVAEQALLKSQRQYQRLADNIPGVIYRFRLAPDGHVSVLYISSGCQELFGVAPATIAADLDNLSAMIHPDDLPSLRAREVESTQNLTYFAWEGRFILADGTVKWIEMASRPELQHDGAIGFDGVMLDVTKRKQAELDLATSQQKYYNLIQSIPGVVWEYDFQLNKFIFVTDRAEALLGYPVSDWISQPDFWADRLHPADRDATIQLYSDAIDNRQSCESEYRMVAADGRIVWVYDIATPVLDFNGKLIATNGLIIDITDKQVALQERQQAEIALRETNDRLAATNAELLRATKLKDEFLATMSHELRTPLNAILGMSECFNEGVFGDINERQTKSIDTIHRSGQHLLSLINDILDVSKIAAGKLELELTSVPLQRLCDTSLALVRAQADRKQIQIDIHIPTQIGMLWIDERRMRQVAINLLSNAIKFTPKGGRITLAAEIVIDPDRDALAPQNDGKGRTDWLRLSVTDTGIGIAAADRDRLFQPFVQIDSSLSRQYEGTGLGLALVKQMVELHGGYVTLESELGRGSCFSLYLPYSSGERHYHSSLYMLDRDEASSPLKPTASIATTTILLVEDNPTDSITFVSYLNVKGYRTIVAQNGSQAIDLALTNHPDLILMDIQMSDMYDTTAIGQLRQHPQLRQIPIVALTALTTSRDRQNCLNAGANECLVKPVKLKELNRTIQTCLN
jgi:PAS domain S-box-containing protein